MRTKQSKSLLNNSETSLNLYRHRKSDNVNRKMSKIPSLHEQAFKYKNTKRLQHDGGRAWIKDSQLHEARKNANGRFVTVADSVKVPDKKTTILEEKDLPAHKPENSPFP